MGDHSEIWKQVKAVNSEVLPPFFLEVSFLPIAPEKWSNRRLAHHGEVDSERIKESSADPWTLPLVPLKTEDGRVVISDSQSRADKHGSIDYDVLYFSCCTTFLACSSLVTTFTQASQRAAAMSANADRSQSGRFNGIWVKLASDAPLWPPSLAL